MKRNILVTGGCGFIGSHIVEHLSCLNDKEIIIIDNLSSGKLDNLAHIPNNAYKLFKEDIRDKEKVEEIISRYQPEAIFHMAAIASVQKSISDPENTFAVNVAGTNNIFESAVSNNVEKVIFASSAAVYGSDPTLPKTEEMTPVPISPYGHHKLENERVGARLSLTGKTKFVALRYFNVYGSRQDPQSEYSGVISIFMDRIALGKDVIIYGKGEQSRDFVYVKDIVQANIGAWQKSLSPFAFFNVGTGVSNTIKKLAEIVYKLYDREGRIVFEMDREGDIKHSLADITKIKKTLNYLPVFILAEGLSELVNINKYKP